IDETGAAVDRVHEAISALSDVESSDPELVRIREGLSDTVLRLSDAAAELSSYLSGFDELGETSLEETEARRAELGSLAPYGETVEEVLAFETRAAAELTDLAAEDRDLDQLDGELEAAEAAMREAGAALSALRRSTAESFSAAVSEELTALSMPKAQVRFEITEREPAVHGLDDIRLTFAPHDSSTGDDIAKVASGGELSRVMLAIEVVRAAEDGVPTYVFDEVDAGIGGRTAAQVGARLARLARTAQVLVVTHLAQVAAYADRQVVVAKDPAAADGAVTTVRVVAGEERTEELARMLSGETSATARQHAADLLARSDVGRWATP
ncbi:MAG TPA: DNA repair protein RecN, partial [Micrococcales bacterium]|nr:DNA repair protein RecN [Micrococcales bacterium]